MVGDEFLPHLHTSRRKRFNAIPANTDLESSLTMEPRPPGSPPPADGTGGPASFTHVAPSPADGSAQPPAAAAAPAVAAPPMGPPPEAADEPAAGVAAAATPISEEEDPPRKRQKLVPGVQATFHDSADAGTNDPSSSPVGPELDPAAAAQSREQLALDPGEDASGRQRKRKVIWEPVPEEKKARPKKVVALLLPSPPAWEGTALPGHGGLPASGSDDKDDEGTCTAATAAAAASGRVPPTGHPGGVDIDAGIDLGVTWRGDLGGVYFLAGSASPPGASMDPVQRESAAAIDAKLASQQRESDKMMIFCSING